MKCEQETEMRRRRVNVSVEVVISVISCCFSSSCQGDGAMTVDCSSAAASTIIDDIHRGLHSVDFTVDGLISYSTP